jgi:putative ABC transport system permease protein
MKLSSAIWEGWIEARTHWFRSCVTVLGIVMGIASLMTMLALTEGRIAGFRERATQTGNTTKIVIVPNPVSAKDAAKEQLSAGLTYEDALVLRRSSALFQWVAPVVMYGAPAFATGGQTNAQMYGGDRDLIWIERFSVEYGRWLTDTDVETHNTVCVIGATIAKELFGSSEAALGDSLAIAGTKYRIVGVCPRYMSEYTKQSQVSGRAQKQAARRKARGLTDQQKPWDPFEYKNTMLAVPISTMEETLVAGYESGGQLLRSNVPKKSVDVRYGGVAMIQIGFRDPSETSEVVKVARQILLGRHHFVEDFEIQDNLKSAEDIDKGIRSQRLAGGVIAGIGLVVGGLGIVNIMVSSITDRTKEIGIRMAVGARQRDVFMQVLGESTLLSTTGGVLGVLASFGLLRVLQELSPEENRPIIEISSVVISLAFSVAVGVLAGAYPAMRAASMNVVEAIKGA